MNMLVLSARDSVDRRALTSACQAVGQPTQTLSSWRVPHELRARTDVRLYAEALFAEVVADPLGLALLTPADDWLTRLPRDILGRSVSLTTLGDARRGPFPIFLKGLDDKLGGFASAVYESAEALPSDVPDTLSLLAAEPVPIDCELRLFCLDGRVLAGSGYWKDNAPWQIPLPETGLEHRARALVDRVWPISDGQLPSACVIDVAIVDGELVIIEGNGAWGSSLYACDGVAALPCVLGATVPRGQAHDLPAAVVRCPRLDS